MNKESKKHLLAKIEILDELYQELKDGDYKTTSQVMGHLLNSIEDIKKTLN